MIITIVKLYQLNIVTAQSILCTNSMSIWNHRIDMDCQDFFKCPQMLNVKGRKEGISHSFCFSKRPVLKCNAWDPEENIIFWVTVTVLCYLNILENQVVFCNWQIWPLIPRTPHPQPRLQSFTLPPPPTKRKLRSKLCFCDNDS